LDPDPEPLYISLLIFDAMQTLNWVLLLVLLFCSALVSGSEVGSQ